MGYNPWGRKSWTGPGNYTTTTAVVCLSGYVPNVHSPGAPCQTWWGGVGGEGSLTQAPKEGAHLGNRRGQLIHSLMNLSQNPQGPLSFCWCCPPPWRGMAQS